MVPEVVAHLGGEVAAAVFPRFGDEHRDRVAQVASAAQQETLGEHRQVGEGVGAEVRVVDRDHTPAGQLQPFRGAGVRDRGLGGLAGDVVVEVQEREHQPDATLVELASERGAADSGEERPRERREDPGPVPRDAVGGHRGAVTHAGQTVERELDDGARVITCGVGDEADAAAVEFRHAQTILMRGHDLLAG